jgi:hypothetical protein
MLQQRTPCCVASHRLQRVGQAPAAYFATCCAALPPPRRVVVRCNIAAEAASGLQPPPRHIRADPRSCLHERRAVAVSGRQQRRSSCLYRVRTRRFRTGTGPAPATSALGLGSPPLHLRQDWARPCHICAGTGLTPATSAPGLGSPLPHLRRDWADRCGPCDGTYVGWCLWHRCRCIGLPMRRHRRHRSRLDGRLLFPPLTLPHGALAAAATTCGLTPPTS